jgi:hypothetical protein
MQIIDTEKTLTSITKQLELYTDLARAIEHIDTYQNRILQLERTLDDLARSCEIAQYSQQYSITEVYRQEAEELLKDRLTLPETENGELKIQIVTGELNADDIANQITPSVPAAADAHA